MFSTRSVVRLVTLACGVLLLLACASPPPKPAAAAAEAPTRPIAQLSERYTTTPSPVDNIDSVVVWRGPAGENWLIASAKDVHNLAVFDADSGANLRRVGAPGTGLGQFGRPNGLAVIDDLLFVVERNNHRVQVLALPDFQPLVVFGGDELKVPYGLWMERTGIGQYDVYVTDSYQLADGRPPPLAQLSERVKRYRVVRDGTGARSSFLGSFGDTSDNGALRWVESIYGDPRHGRLLIAEEFEEIGSTLRVYDMAGRYLGIDLDRSQFDGQAEGIALWACPDGSGYWLATDQRQDGNRFQVFDRVTLEHIGGFAGAHTSNTDGIYLQPAATPAFPRGVFFAVHDDQAVSAFDWRDIAKAVGLRESCE
ncbi:MAG: phytase [Lysobacterales bacterium]|nr:phytase [Xanthomonadales bacterium]MCB1611528.1 phytase [Xanthomonadales bacterium]MCP5475183.1 phytase [Rhodanobacteraceae bacterium]